MFSKLISKNYLGGIANKNLISTGIRRFGSGHGHGHHEPHVPVFYDKLGQFCLVTAYVWILYRIQQDNGQLLGLYKPWLHEHHHEHLHYVDNETEGDSVPTLSEEEEEEEHEEEEEEDEE